MKKFVKDKYIVREILFSIVVIIVLLILGYKIINSEFVRFNHIKIQFKSVYGISLTEGKVRGDKFYATSEDGVYFYGECDFIGNIKSESYLNYYYADECAEHLYEEIGSCFDDCIMITNAEFQHVNAKLFEFKSIDSFDEYYSALNDGDYIELPTIFVLLRETEDIEHVRNAIEILKSSGRIRDVIFQMIPDDMYDAHVSNGVYCYFNSSSAYMKNLCDLLEDSKDNYGRFGDLVLGKKYRCGIISKYFTEILIDGEWVEI